MKQKIKSIILDRRLALSLLILMWLIPQGVWAQHTHTFDEANDPGHTLCTGCGHSFFRYTATAQIKPYNGDNLKDASGNKLTYTHTFSDGQGVMEFNGTLTTIGIYVFYNCSFFTGDLIIPNGVTSIGESAFRYCSGFMGSLTIPNSVTTIENQAFSKCSGFTGNLTIPNSVTSIGVEAFRECSGFTGDLVIPNSVTSIGERAFYYCSSFNGDLVIPNSLTSIGEYVFYGCNILQSVYNYATTPQVYNGLFSSDIYYNKPLYVPSASLAAYKEAAGWMKFLRISCIEHDFDEDGFCKGCGYDRMPRTDRIFSKMELIGGVTAAISTDGDYEWRIDDKGNLSSTNRAINNTTSQTTITFTSKEAFVLSFDWSVSSETGYDKFTIQIDGVTKVDAVSGIKSGSVNDMKLTAGSHTLVLKYSKDVISAKNDDMASIANIKAVAEHTTHTFDEANDPGRTLCTGCGHSFFRYTATARVDPKTPENLKDAGGNTLEYTTTFSDGQGVLEFNGTLTTIGQQAFYNRTGFTGDLIIPNGVTTIGDNAFQYCDGFKGNLVIPNSVISIERDAFYKCTGFKGNLVIPNGVASIGYRAFYGCTGFSGDLTIGNSVTTIGEASFYGCTGLSGDLIIPDGVTSIGTSAFRECSGFNVSLTIPNSVTSIGNYAFYGCTNLQSVYNYATTPQVHNGLFSSDIYDNKPLYVPSASLAAYKAATGWKNFKSISCIEHTFDDETDPGHTLCTGCGHSFFRYTAATQVNPYRPENLMDASGNTLEYTNTFSDGQGVLEFNGTLTTIGERAFYYRDGFTGSLIIPNGVISISDNAFEYCDGFKGNLVIPNSVTSIGDFAFWYCSGFNGSLTIGNGVTSIGMHAFSQCGFTGDLTIPNSVTSIGDFAFNGCSGFNGSLTIGNSVASIGEYAFYSCSGFTGDLTIPNSVTSIGNYAFNGCSGFNGSLTIGNGVTSIGTSAFSFCSGFEGSLTIGNSVTSIGDDAFSQCGFTGDLIIPNSVTSIGERAFYGCYFNGSLTIGNSVTSIGERAFYACDGLEGDLTIPNSVTTIGDRAFNDCCNLTGPLTIGNGVTSIGSSAFSGCSALTSVLLQSLPSMGSDVFSNVSAPKSISLTDESYIGTSTSNYPTFAGATYERKMGNEWGTLVLPFNVNYNDENGKYRFYKLKNAEDESMTFAPMANGNIATGTPVVVKMIGDKGEDDKYTLSIEQIMPMIGLTVSATSCDAEGWTLNGTFQSVEQDCSEGNLYYIAENKFWFANQDFPLGAFRAYFQAPSAAGSSALRYFIVEEEATGIRSVEEEQEASQPQIYDLSGRSIQNAQNGLQIMNGKVIIKK